MTSAARKRDSRSGSRRSRLAASSRTGMTMLIRSRAGVGASCAPRTVVETPVVVEIGEPRVGERSQPFPQLRTGLGAYEGRDAARGREVTGEPLEDGRDAGRLAVTAGFHAFGRVRQEGG